MTGQHALALTNASAGYGRRGSSDVIRDISFTVKPGEIVGLIGETGSGKSTIARAALGLIPVSTGRVDVAGVDVASLTKRELRDFRRTGAIQYVFQDPLRSLDPGQSIRDALAEPLQIRGDADGASITQQIEEVIHITNVDPALLERLPSELSGGQRQRVSVARALIASPTTLILDEPVSALDAVNRVQILELLASLRSTGIGELFISHDLGSVAGLTDRTVVLYRGRVVEDAPTAQIVNDPQHPYTQLIVGSAPTFFGRRSDADWRRAKRALLEYSAVLD